MFGNNFPVSVFSSKKNINKKFKRFVTTILFSPQKPTPFFLRENTRFTTPTKTTKHVSQQTRLNSRHLTLCRSLRHKKV